MRRASISTTGAIIATLLLGAFAFGARAHGIGKTQLLNVESGPYLISAWTDPDPLRADETHVVVAVTEPETREPIVSGVEVSVMMISIADPAISFTETAGTDNVNQLLYAAEFNDRVTAGRWQVKIAVSGARGGGESVSFEVVVGPARGFNWLWIGVGGLALVVIIWVAASMRSETPRSGRNRRGRSRV